MTRAGWVGSVLSTCCVLLATGTPPAQAAQLRLDTPPPAQGGPLTWHGGRLPSLDAGVISSPRLYISFLGPSWQTGFTDAAGYTSATAMSYVLTLAGEIGGSAWEQTLTEYCVGVPIGASSCPAGSQFIQNNPGQLGGYWVDTTPLPTPFVDPAGSVPGTHQGPITGPGGAVERAAAHFGWDPNGFYLILLPAGIDPDWFPSYGCAYHTAMGSGLGPNTPTAFGVVPYQADSSWCGRNTVYFQNDAFGHGWLDGESGAISHEYAEGITDFNSADGWVDDTLDLEVADKCGAYGKGTLGAHTFAVTWLWSNRDGVCKIATVTGGPPPAPTGVTGVPASRQVTLSWTPPSSNGGTPISAYIVAASPAVSGSPFTFAGPGTTQVVTGLSDGTAYTFTVAAVNAAGSGPPSTPSAAITPSPPQQFAGGGFTPIVPYRALDTRSGLGGSTTLRPGQSITLPLAVGGAGRVPTAATGVVLNVTAVNPGAGGYLTVWPAGARQPLASNLNFSAGQVVPNLVEVALGAGGAVSFYNGSPGQTDVLADVAGYTGSAGDLYNALAPVRLLDTRTSSSPLRAGETRTLAVAGANGVPSTASGAVLNVTVTNPSAGGFVTVWPAGQPQPTVSNLNFGPGQTVPNRVQVQLGQAGAVSIFNLGGTSDVIVDLNGYFSSSGGSSFTGVAPTRLLDTRLSGVPLQPGATLILPVTAGPADVPLGVKAVVLNITAVSPTSGGFLTVWPTGVQRPGASDLNFVPGMVVPNLVVAAVAGGGVSIYNSAGVTDLVVDVAGWYS